jgi:hypothetical protein
MLLNSRRGCLGRSEKRKFATLHVLRRPLWPQLRERIRESDVLCARRATFTPRRVRYWREETAGALIFKLRFFQIRIARCKSA